MPEFGGYLLELMETTQEVLVPCLLLCLQRALQKIVNMAFVLEEQKSGTVGQ